MNAYIYILCDPRTGECRYVGKTCNPAHRLAAHISKHRKDYKSNWVKSLLGDGLRPEMKIVETIENSDDSDWQVREVHWIAKMKSRGCNLTNLDEGGKAGRRLSEETKRKLSELNKGKKATEATRLKMSATRKGVRFTPGHAAKIGEANRRRVVSEKTCSEISRVLTLNHAMKAGFFIYGRSSDCMDVAREDFAAAI